MSRKLVYKSEGVTHHTTQYTKQEIIDAWQQSGQGHDAAVKRGQYCVLFQTKSQDEAAYLSAMFVRHCFAIPTCCHWDGETLSFHCGEAGSGAITLMGRVRAMLIGYQPAAHESGPLFAPEEP